MRISKPVLLAAAALGALTAGALALAPLPETETLRRAVVIERDTRDVEIFLRLPASEFAAVLERSEEGRALLARIVTDGQIDTGLVQDLKVEIGEAALPAFSASFEGEAAVLDVMGLSAHPVDLVGGFSDPLDAWNSIGICLVPEEAPMVDMAEAVIDLGVIVYPAPQGEFTLRADLPGGMPRAASAWDTALSPLPARIEDGAVVAGGLAEL